MLTILLVFLFIINISIGSVSIPFMAIIKSLFGKLSNEAWQVIIIDYRFPKALTAVLVGSGLGVSGLLMQTLFKNPLAGPFVLGVTSGASLGVALLIMGAGLFGGLLSGVLLSKWGLIAASSLGSFIVLSTVIGLAIRIKDTMSILIIGLMFGSITAAFVSVLSYASSAEQLQQYIFWGFGSLGNLSWSDLFIFFIIYAVGMLLSLLSIKSLNTWLLGEVYAKSLGLNIKKSRIIIIIATSILAGAITAFAGPIAFIGIAIPHMARQLFNTSNHKILLPAIILLGASVMLVCDSIAQILVKNVVLPINAITAMVGAPVVIWLLVKKPKMIF